MARKSVVELEAQANATIEDNLINAISPADVRQMFLDFLNAFRPAYGVLQQTGTVVQTYGATTPVKVAWNNAQDSEPSQTTSSAASGRITRSERGTAHITFTMDFEATNGRFITFTLYKNGAPTPWRITGNGGGAGNPVSVVMSAIDYADPAAFYEVFASAEVDGISTTISNGSLIVSISPVNNFT